MKSHIPAICNVVALVLLVAGALSPGWIVFKNISGISIHIGLFYIAGYTTIPLVGFIEFQIEVIIAVISCILATIFMWVYVNGKQSHSFLLTPIITNLVSAILTWVAVGRFLNAVILLNKYSIDMGVPYSLILGGLGGILCFVTMIIICIKKHKDSKGQGVSQPGGVVISAPGQPQYNSGYGQEFSQKSDGFSMQPYNSNDHQGYPTKSGV